MYVIDGRTGKLIQRVFGADEAIGVSLGKEASEKLIRDFAGESIAIHNHPTNLWPTGDDYAVAGYRKYRMGIVVTHSGRVFKYTTGGQPILPTTINTTLVKYFTSPYNLDVDEAFSRAMQDLKGFGIQCVELK